MFPVDYHIHTPLCGHADGTPEDFAEAAIAANVAEIGFSDHAPLPEPLRAGITMSTDEIENYLTLVQDAKERYAGRLSVKIGLEVDYPLHASFPRWYFSDPRFDYLIGSCHFIDGWGFDNPDHAAEFDRRDVNAVYRRYFEILRNLVQSNLFNIIGHIDLVKKFGHRATGNCSDAIRAIFSPLPENVAVEINTSGLRKPVREMYPSREILGVLFERNVPVTLGSDSHTPCEVGYEFYQALSAIKDAGYRKISGFVKRKRFDITL